MDNTDVIIVKDPITISQFLSDPSFNEISVDLEGHNLCRDGDIYTIQVFIPSSKLAYIFDCRKLTKSNVVDCLKNVFNCFHIKKYMFDCRSDADALYHHYGLVLNNVIDIQLYEIGYRKSTGNGSRFYNALSKTLRIYEEYIDISSKELQIKNKISEQHKRKNYEVELECDEMLNYLIIDIYYLDRLYNFFKTDIKSSFMKKIKEETLRRQDSWKKINFVNDRSNAVSAI